MRFTVQRPIDNDDVSRSSSTRDTAGTSPFCPDSISPSRFSIGVPPLLSTAEQSRSLLETNPDDPSHDADVIVETADRRQAEDDDDAGLLSVQVPIGSHENINDIGRFLGPTFMIIMIKENIVLIIF